MLAAANLMTRSVSLSVMVGGESDSIPAGKLIDDGSVNSSSVSNDPGSITAEERRGKVVEGEVVDRRVEKARLSIERVAVWGQSRQGEGDSSSDWLPGSRSVTPDSPVLGRCLQLNQGTHMDFIQRHMP